MLSWPHCCPAPTYLAPPSPPKLKAPQGWAGDPPPTHPSGRALLLAGVAQLTSSWTASSPPGCHVRPPARPLAPLGPSPRVCPRDLSCAPRSPGLSSAPLGVDPAAPDGQRRGRLLTRGLGLRAHGPARSRRRPRGLAGCRPLGRGLSLRRWVPAVASGGSVAGDPGFCTLRDDDETQTDKFPEDRGTPGTPRESTPSASPGGSGDSGARQQQPQARARASPCLQGLSASLWRPAAQPSLREVVVGSH